MPDDRATQSFFLIAANHDRGFFAVGTDDRRSLSIRTLGPKAQAT